MKNPELQDVVDIGRKDMTEIERNSEIAWFVLNRPFSKNVTRITLQYFMIILSLYLSVNTRKFNI